MSLFPFHVLEIWDLDSKHNSVFNNVCIAMPKWKLDLFDCKTFIHFTMVPIKYTISLI